ncbi:MAG: serine hydrolase domain-containing protein [Pseudomonadales bacterium]
MSVPALEAMHRRMDWYVEQSIIPCCATVVMRGTEVIDEYRTGYLDYEAQSPLPADAIFRMYSNTKIVTAVAAMMLYEEGRFALDDALADYLPAFKDPKILRAGAKSISDTEPCRSQITIAQTLSHSAGWSYGFIEPQSVIDAAYISQGVDIFSSFDSTLEQLCDRLASLPLAFQPGTQWRYSLASDVTARLVEVLSGQRFDAFLAERIFEPLGMRDTAFWVAPEKQDRFINMPAPVDLFDPMKSGFNPGDDPHTGQYCQERALLSGGGGLVSSVADYLDFLRMIVNGGEWQGARLLQPETLRLMRTNVLAPGLGVNFPMWHMPGTTFGLGFALKERLSADEPAAMQGEYHWGGMAGTHTWMAPEANLTGVCMTQLMPGFWHPFSHEFKAAVYQHCA